MATTGQPKPSAPNQHTINVTDLRTETREILENAHFRGWHYIVQRAGQPMIAILDHDEYERLLALAAIGDSKMAFQRANPAEASRRSVEFPSS